MSDRTLRVYRIDVEYPSGSQGWAWAPDTDLTFRWPQVKRYLTRSGAEARAALLRGYGATAVVVASNPVTWPDDGGDDD